MSMPGYMPTDEDIAAMVRDLEKTDPQNANPEYARRKLIRTKLMLRDMGRVDEDLLHKEMEEFKPEPKENDGR